MDSGLEFIVSIYYNFIEASGLLETIFLFGNIQYLDILKKVGTNFGIFYFY